MAATRALWIGGESAHNGMPYSAIPSFINLVFDHTNDKLTFLFFAEEAATITKLYVRMAAVAATSPTFRISLQGGGVRVADGTIKGATNNAKKTFQPSALGWTANTGYWLTLDESYTCSRGEYLAVVIEYSSGTPSTDSFSYGVNTNASTMLPLVISTDAGVDTEQKYPGIMGYASSSKSYGFPIAGSTQITIDSGTNPDEYGLKFSLPSSLGSTFKIACMAWISRLAVANGTINVYLYDTDGTTVLQSVLWDTDWQTGTVIFQMHARFDETTLSTLNFGSTYRIGVQPVDTSSDFRFNTLEFLDAQDAAVMNPTDGGTWHLCSRNNQGSWTDTATNHVPQLRLLISDITPPAGGGTFMPRPIQIGM